MLELLNSLFLLMLVVGSFWTYYYGWQEGIGWFLLMFLCQIGIPIWYILKLMGDKREFVYLKYPGLLWLVGFLGYLVCQILLVDQQFDQIGIPPNLPAVESH